MEVQVEGEEVTEVKGNKCKEGIEYARREVFSPERILTSTVK
jgi:CxxC motif-containing protein